MLPYHWWFLLCHCNCHSEFETVEPLMGRFGGQQSIVITVCLLDQIALSRSKTCKLPKCKLPVLHFLHIDHISLLNPKIVIRCNWVEYIIDVLTHKGNIPFSLLFHCKTRTICFVERPTCFVSHCIDPPMTPVNDVIILSLTLSPSVYFGHFNVVWLIGILKSLGTIYTLLAHTQYNIMVVVWFP